MRTWFLMLLVVSLVTCCDQAPAPGDGESASLEQAVYTTFHPTAWMAERIAGGAVPVICPLPTGEDAIFWKPSRDVLARYQGAQVVVVNGAEFEKWVAGASLPRSRTCDTVAGLDDQFITYEGVTHSHGGSEGTHTHEGLDGHTWVDPEMAKVQALRSGYDEAILLSPQGYVSECSGENLFMVKNGTIVTPPTSAGALEGITQNAVHRMAEDLGIPYVEGNILRSDLYVADEAFLSGTAAEVVPIRSVDDRQIGDPGPITRAIQEVFFEAVRGKRPEYAEWNEHVG